MDIRVHSSTVTSDLSNLVILFLKGKPRGTSVNHNTGHIVIHCWSYRVPFEASSNKKAESGMLIKIHKKELNLKHRSGR
jgi:hypothetical protein